MPTLDYQFDTGQTVYNIDPDDGIRDAVVKKIEATIQYGSTALQYTIAFKKTAEGFATVDESTLFPTAESAWEAYRAKYLDN